MPDWLEFVLFVFAWSPILILLHEAGHAFAALALPPGGTTALGLLGIFGVAIVLQRSG